MNWILGKWTRENREQRRWSQDILAEKVGVTKSYISKIENSTDYMEVTREVLDKLAGAFVLSACDGYEGACFIRPNEDTDIVMLWHLPRGTRTPVQITDPEVLAATRKAIAEKLKTK